jgi:hypothetical protein
VPLPAESGVRPKLSPSRRSTLSSLVMFAIHFDQPEQARRAGEVLAFESFRVELQQQADGSVVVVAFPTSAPVSVDAVSVRLHILADQFGGESLGRGGLTSFGVGGQS